MCKPGTKIQTESLKFLPPCWDAGYSNASTYLTALAFTLVSRVQFEPAFHFHESYHHHVQLKMKLQSKNCCHESKGLAIF